MLLFVVWYLISFKGECVLYFVTFIQTNLFPAFQENYHRLLICLCTLVAYDAEDTWTQFDQGLRVCYHGKSNLVFEYMQQA